MKIDLNNGLEKDLNAHLKDLVRLCGNYDEFEAHVIPFDHTYNVNACFGASVLPYECVTFKWSEERPSVREYRTALHNLAIKRGYVAQNGKINLVGIFWRVHFGINAETSRSCRIRVKGQGYKRLELKHLSLDKAWDFVGSIADVNLQAEGEEISEEKFDKIIEQFALFKEINQSLAKCDVFMPFALEFLADNIAYANSNAHKLVLLGGAVEHLEDIG